jgi:hypothetical protein
MSASEIEVHITVNGGNITVDPDPFWVHKLQDQTVKWVCQADQPFTVEFGADCPFYESQFSKDYPCSGLVRRNVVTDDNRTYKYTVRVGNNVLDPGGGVKK